ncbi:MAG: hypothetical protein KF729_10235 [Sandaracinaceae bacterium]|nr:hypothetical protein [Sandaracinaceae bacterium]
MRRALATTSIALLLLAVFAGAADAQRRGTRGRRRPPTAEPAEPAADPSDATGVPDSPFDDEPPARPASQPARQPAPASPGTARRRRPRQPRAPPPAPAEAPPAEADAGPPPPDVAPIREEYVALMDDLVQARSRVSALGAELFRTQITIDVQDRTGDDATLARLVIYLDGAPVFRSDGPAEGLGSGRQVFSGSLAPGPHVLRLEVEQRARRDEAYRYTLQEDFRFQVARERLSEVTLVLEDGSDMASSYPSGGEGRYEVRTRMRVATRALPAR